MKIIFKNGEYLKLYVDSIKEVIEHTNINITSKGISINAMDNGQIFFCDLFIDSKNSNIELFECLDKCIIGLSIKNLSLILNCCSIGDKLELNYNTTTSDIINIIIYNNTKKSEFELKLMNIYEDNMVIPELVYDNNIKMNIKDFKQTIGEIVSFSSGDVKDSCELNITNKMFNVSLKNDIIGFIKMSFNENIKLISSSDIVMKFSLKYLMILSKTNLSKQVSISISKDLPLLLEFNDNSSYIKLYLAGKLDEF